MSVLEWDGCLNVRDLGGLATDDGGETRHGAIVRADSVRRLTRAGWDSLVGYGIRRIVDLRWREELALDPPEEAPVEVVHVPLFGAVDPVYGVELTARLDAAESMSDYFGLTYIDFLERYRENFGPAVRAVAEAPGPVVVHCSAGKDRTGLVCALVLRLAGVSPEDVASDYAISARNLAPDHAQWIDEAPDDVHRNRRVRLADAPAEAMIAVLDELERAYGGARGYLLGAGATEAQLALIRERLRG